MTLPRVPSFSSRPGFPQGLRVLLIEGDLRSRQAAQSLLAECHYQVTSCSSSADAVARFHDANETFDVALVEASVVVQADNSALIDKLKQLPLILMSDSGNASEVMRGIKIGAVDFLEKPLSLLKLRNIWQHTVRQMMKDSRSCGFKRLRDSDALLAGDVDAPCMGSSELDAGVCGNEHVDSGSGVSSPTPGSRDGCSAQSSSTQIHSMVSSRRKQPRELTSASVSNRPPLAIKPASLTTPFMSHVPPCSWNASQGPPPGVVMGTPILSGHGPGLLQPPVVGPLGFCTPQFPFPPPMMAAMSGMMWPGMAAMMPQAAVSGGLLTSMAQPFYNPAAQQPLMQPGTAAAATNLHPSLSTSDSQDDAPLLDQEFADDPLLSGLPGLCCESDAAISSLEEALSSGPNVIDDMADADWLFDGLASSPRAFDDDAFEFGDDASCTPLGLNLKKTPSLMDMITSCLTSSSGKESAFDVDMLASFEPELEDC